MTNLDKLNLLFDDYLTSNKKSFMTLRTANEIVKNSGDPDLANINLKKMLESGMLPNSGQTESSPNQWRIFHSESKVNESADSNSDEENTFYDEENLSSKAGSTKKSKKTKVKYEYDKFAIIALIVIGVVIAFFKLTKSESDAPNTANITVIDPNRDVTVTVEPDDETQSKSGDIKSVLLEITSLFDDLQNFKDEKTFHEYGFGSAGPYSWWFERVDELNNSPHAKEILLNYGFAIGDLQMLGLEYVKSRGAETEYSMWAKNRILDGIRPHRF